MSMRITMVVLERFANKKVLNLTMFNLKTTITKQLSVNRSSLFRTLWLFFAGTMLIFSCRKPSWNLSLKPEIISINAEVIDSSTVQLSVKNNPSIPVERGFVYVDQNKIDDNSIVFNLNKISNDSLSVYTSNLPLGKYYYLIELENEIGKTRSKIDSFILNIAGTISTLECLSAQSNGNLLAGANVSGVSSEIYYSGGNGGIHNGEVVFSAGVTGLTATLGPGSFSNSNGFLTYSITGTPSAAGTANFALNIGGQSCLLTRTVDESQGAISYLDCGSATNNGTLTEGVAASGVSCILSYSGGNGGAHNGQIVTSTGVTGLTATLAPGSFAGSGSLTYFITGMPSAAGTANFALNIGGLSCSLPLTVQVNFSSQYPPGSIFCASGPTAIVEVINPSTGRTWMDRNLGATQVATSYTDEAAYGDLYQWGRGSDGHQCRNSSTTTSLSSTDTPSNGAFINTIISPYDWRSPQNNSLWQGTNGVNNPCPAGYRVPTDSELSNEFNSWNDLYSTGAFSSPLKLTNAGRRWYSSGIQDGVDGLGSYWSSTIYSNNPTALYISMAYNAYMPSQYRSMASSIRCIKN